MQLEGNQHEFWGFIMNPMKKFEVKTSKSTSRNVFYINVDGMHLSSFVRSDS